MADAAAGSADRRGRGRGGRRGRGRGDRGAKKPLEGEQWVPCTKLGRLVRDGKIQQLEEIYLHSLTVKEYQIIDFFLPPVDKTGAGKLKEEVMKVMPVQKQTAAGQRTRFKAIMIVGDGNGHLGLGTKCAKEVATAIRGAIINAKLNIIPVRRGYWGNKIGAPHTVANKTAGKCGSVRVRLIPAPRGSGIVAARVPKKLIAFAGIEDVFTQSYGKTKTLGNFARATFNAIKATYSFLTPDIWGEYALTQSPYQEHSDYLHAAHGKHHH